MNKPQVEGNVYLRLYSRGRRSNKPFWIEEQTDTGEEVQHSYF